MELTVNRLLEIAKKRHRGNCGFFLNMDSEFLKTFVLFISAVYVY